MKKASPMSSLEYQPLCLFSPMSPISGASCTLKPNIRRCTAIFLVAVLGRFCGGLSRPQSKVFNVVVSAEWGDVKEQVLVSLSAC